MLLFSLVPMRVSAQATEPCTEAHLRDLGVAVVSCAPDLGSSCGGTLLPGNDNPEKVWNYLINKGLTALQASAAMGNLQHEGGFNPRQLEIAYSDAPHESDTIPPPIGPAGQPGFGIVQWTTVGRKQGLQALADSKKLPVSDLGIQLDFMWSELEGPYKAVALDPLRKSTDLAEAVSIWQDHYEVGTVFAPRFAAAQDWLTKYGSGAASGSASSGGSGGCGIDASGCPTGPINDSETTLAAGVRVHACIAPEVERIMSLALSQGIKLRGEGWVSSDTQVQKRRNNNCPDIYTAPASSCSPPTARPGESRHERGTAIDFYCDASLVNKTDACFKFLQENTKLINLDSEAWHWSVDGS